MKKALLIASMLILNTIGAANASGLDLTINYDPIVIPHGAQISFDISKGKPVGLQGGTFYTFTCQSSANSDIGMSFESYVGGATWNQIVVSGKSYYQPYQFILKVGSPIQINSLRFTTGQYSTFIIHNLDNVTDVTLTCSAVPDINSTIR